VTDLVFRRLFNRGGFRRPSFVRAAHYFADGWPLDSLQVMRMPALREDLKRLHSDGFNTIILVVPWRGLQSSQSPIEYDDFHRKQLRLVLAEAQRTGLAVLLRVAYAHQVMLGPAIGGIRQAQGLLTDPLIEEAWLDYHREIGRLVADYPCCIGGFASWEELWHAFGNWQARDQNVRRTAAISSGYLSYLDARDIAHNGEIPSTESPDHAYYLAFVNHRMTQLFERARNCWPQLGVEFRVDKDLVSTDDGPHWFENNSFLDWEPNRYSYWAPFIGAKNEGEELSAEAAAASLKYMLESSSASGSCTGQVLEQFNFVDNTQKYLGTHAQIATDQIEEFLTLAAPLLQTYAGGYGLWAARDYRLNILYNTAFLNGGHGWVLQGGDWKRSGGLKMSSGARLVQRIHPRVAWIPRIHPFSEIKLDIDLNRSLPPRSGALRARLNGGIWSTLQASAVDNRLSAKVPVDFERIFSEGIYFELENRGAALSILRLQLYDQTYTAGVRGVDAEPGPYLAGIRRFNQRLSLPPEPSG
jgi:hypothetical protein